LPPEAAILETHALTKAYGHVRAMSDVSLEVQEREILALVGDNGAGKSTLVKALCGAIRPDSGEVRLDGELRTFHNPREARRAGISVVYQDLALVEGRDVSHNIFLGELPRRAFIVNKRLMDRESRKTVAAISINAPNVRTRVSLLSGGQRQAVAIARAVHEGGRLMFLDEPTAALGVQESAHVLKVMVDLKETHGMSLVVVSHNLEHVFSIADRIAVMRSGRLVGVRTRRETSPKEIVELITGAAAIAAAGNGSN
jgi:ABC-type sugar transport system ATPase subunit